MRLYFPSNLPGNCVNNGAPWPASAIADNNDKVAFVLQAPKTGTLARVAFLTGTVTSAATIGLRIETVSATSGGVPSGTLYDAAGTGSQATPAATTWCRPQINGSNDPFFRCGWKPISQER